ncbi:MAG TPA: HdeD family acid-resistance protein [Ktedonosporobacter sp.]|nr:HdeD family acid-resistance protein [Ktedonosporobacter sp.]
MNMFTLGQRSSNHWQMLAIRGVVAILFGIVALMWPGRTTLALVYLFGAFALLDGIAMVVLAFRAREYMIPWWMLLIEGLAGIIIGLLAFFSPLITAIALIELIAIWAIIVGFMQIISAITLRDAITGEWILALSGILSVILGVLLFFQPINGLLSITWLIGIYAIVFGAIAIVRAFRYRSLARA